MEDKIKLGISACLLGENVRYDGGHKLDRYLVEMVGPFVHWTPICPEVECGLSVPRESMRLVDSAESHRLLTRRTGIDHSGRMTAWAQLRLDQLESEQICGFIFKSKSPSSGMRDIKVYNDKGMPVSKDAGLFAKALMERFPYLPVEDEGRLNDAGIRENFIERVFVHHRWNKYLQNGATRQGLVDFHTEHKLLIMAHSDKHLRELGKMTAAPHMRKPQELLQTYFVTLMEALKLKSTVRKNVNVLQHITGYFKKLLGSEEKQHVLRVIEEYHRGWIPLIVPVTLLNYFVSKYSEPYLKRQHYLYPHPAEMMLRNHV